METINEEIAMARIGDNPIKSVIVTTYSPITVTRQREASKSADTFYSKL